MSRVECWPQPSTSLAAGVTAARDRGCEPTLMADEAGYQPVDNGGSNSSFLLSSVFLRAIQATARFWFLFPSPAICIGRAPSSRTNAPSRV